jgi:hypothetical protein
MEESHFKFEHLPKKIKYSIEDKVNYIFLQTILIYFSNLEGFFSIIIQLC